MSIEYDQDSFLAGLAFARNVVGWVGGRGESWINESTVTTFNGVLIGANGYVTAKPLRDIVDVSYDDPVTSRAVASAIASALSSKQDSLTFDSTPQIDSFNPVYSNGVAVQLNLKAPLNSPSFSGEPHAPTPVASASNTQIATTEFVMRAIASSGGGTEVIANPTGAATGTLNKIQIEQVIYSVPSGSPSDFRPTIAQISFGSAWSSSEPYTQIVSASEVVPSNAKVDLQPTANQLVELKGRGVTALVISNNSGILTAYALGSVPSSMTMQCTIEVVNI